MAKNNKLKLSICISTYNAERTIEMCLKSIFSSLQLPKKDFEVIIIDNFSSDLTLEIVKKFSIDKIIKKKCNRAEARNICVKESSGELIAMIESDKKVTKALFNTCFKEFEKDSSLGYWGDTSVTPFYESLKKSFLKSVIFLFFVGEKHIKKE